MLQRYELHRAHGEYFLDTFDGQGTRTTHRIAGNTATEVPDQPKPRTVVASGAGEWSDGPGLVEFRAPNWKLRIEGDRATVRTGDGADVPHLFSGIGVGRTGESAVARLDGFFRFETGGGC